MRPAIICATVITIAITVALGAAVAFPCWRSAIQPFQIAIGGLGAIAAALVAHDGQSSTARENRRQKDQDRNDLKGLILHQSLQESEMICGYCERMVARLSNREREYTKTEMILSLNSICRTASIKKAWGNVVLFPSDISEKLAAFITSESIIDSFRTILSSDALADKMEEKDISIIVQRVTETRDSAAELIQTLRVEIQAHEKHHPPRR